jgi:23S rRNA (guanosine2251-2'-O)-methyltransferase
MNSRLVLILDNIRSSHNAGSILRTAACFGVEEVVLGGITPGPLDRFGRPDTKVLKVSLGAEKLVKWKKEKDLASLIQGLKKDGWRISALEQGSNSTDISRAEKGEKRVLILGEETGGVSNKLLEMCDEVLEIPQGGKKESLNVSVAAGIAVHSLLAR